MSRYIPEHPEKGSAEAYAWAEKMRAARQKKARLKHQIRQAGLEAEAKFFGPGGLLAPKALQKHKLNPSKPTTYRGYSIYPDLLNTVFYIQKDGVVIGSSKTIEQAKKDIDLITHKNPGAKWHEGMESVAGRYRREAQTQTEKHIYAGMEMAHKDSASAARKLGMNPGGISLSAAMVYDGWDLTVGTSKNPKVFSRLLNGFEQHLQKESKGWRLLEANKRMGQREMLSKGVYDLLTDAVIDANKHAYVKNPKKFSHKDALACAEKIVKHEKASLNHNPIAIMNPPQVEGTIYNNAIEIRAQKTGGPLKGHYKHIFDPKKVRILGLTDGTVLLQHKDGKPLWMSRKDYERSGRQH